MRLFLILCSLIISNKIVAQDYFINEEIVNNKIKFNIPFEPDWSKDFFVEAALRVPFSYDASNENAGLLFGYKADPKSFYAMYISNGSIKQKQYKDFIKIRGYNVTSFENNDVWQNTSLVNSHGFNRLQFYKIDDELFFSINDQVIQHISNIESKGNELRLTTGKTGIGAHHVIAYYLDSEQKNNLKERLLVQLNDFKNTGLHHKLAKTYKNVLEFQNRNKLHDFYRNLDTEIKDSSGKKKHCFTYNNTTKNLTLDSYNENDNSFAKNVATNVELNIPNKPVKILEDYFYIGKYKGNSILVINERDIVYKYDYEKDSFEKLFKSKYGRYQIDISENKEYLFVGIHAYVIETGEEISINTGFLGNGQTQRLSHYGNKIVLLNMFDTRIIDLKTNEIQDVKEKGTFQGKYHLIINGRELTIVDKTTDKTIAEKVQLLVKDRRDGFVYYDLQYYPECNEVYVSSKDNSDAPFYFSHNDKVIDVNSFIVNIKTNEIIPLLPEKTFAEREQKNQESQALQQKAKLEVESFLSQFKTFGSYYELNYSNFDYVNVSSSELLNKNGIRGTTYVIGKFCTYNGADLLAIGVTKDQYQIELISVSYGFNGVFVRRKLLGITQNVNGYTTQIATVKVYRISSDGTKYSLVVNDGKETKIQLTSDCK